MEMFTADTLQSEALKEHKIRLIDNSELVLMNENMRLNKTDCLFSVTQTLFRGL
jgi:hypothetical protein